MNRVAGILREQFAWNQRAFSAMRKSFVLAAHRNGALSVKGLAVCFNTSSAIAGVFIGTTSTM